MAIAATAHQKSAMTNQAQNVPTKTTHYEFIPVPGAAKVKTILAASMIIRTIPVIIVRKTRINATSVKTIAIVSTPGMNVLKADAIMVPVPTPG